MDLLFFGEIGIFVLFIGMFVLSEDYSLGYFCGC